MFQQLFLSGSNVCSNCFRERRVEVVTPRRKWDDLDAVPTESRPAEHTTSEWVPGPPVSKAELRFCSCGAHGAHCRIWDDDDVDPERFDELLKAALVTAIAKGQQLTRPEVEEIVSTARRRRRRGDSVNEAFGTAFDSVVDDGLDADHQGAAPA